MACLTCGKGPKPVVKSWNGVVWTVVGKLDQPSLSHNLMTHSHNLLVG